ncbi:hypothetical protein FYK55_22395 [Roseiconus nitratireducens]|uniref:Uncharacterized protein n=1 Tax=Roseiconus nitratireducens TaxID=2605748 RepID=A0A5M6D195_9BACT|nr:hypothetical protein [Roseiconus nitratireducens]KAA5540062.1 hypothetical protein FYK55_22395 [Roseiconus nitratireducens]
MCLEDLPRFTVLRHAIGEGLERLSDRAGRSAASDSDTVPAHGVHWDWLFAPPPVPGTGLITPRENPSDAANPMRDRRSLWTWATEPLSESGWGRWTAETFTSVPATRLADHRFRYLDFQGDLGADRGFVSQIATGHYRPVGLSSDPFEAELIVAVNDRSQPPTVGYRLKFSRQNSGPTTTAGQSWQLRIETPGTETESPRR